MTDKPKDEIRWYDAWIRWEKGSKAVYDEDLDDDDAPIVPTDTFRYHSPKDEHFDEFELEIQGFPYNAGEVWTSTGLTVWKASHHLCEYWRQDYLKRVADNPHMRILELGAGLGRCGLYAHRLAPDREVVITDGDSDTLSTLRTNVASNAASDHVSCHQLLWGNEHALTFCEKHGQFDVILGSDLVYVRHVLPLLFETVKTILKVGGVFILAFAIRENNEMERWMVLEDADMAGLKYEVTEQEDDVSVIVFQK